MKNTKTLTCSLGVKTKYLYVEKIPSLKVGDRIDVLTSPYGPKSVKGVRIKEIDRAEKVLILASHQSWSHTSIVCKKGELDHIMETL